MRAKIFLTLLLMYTVITRFWQIDTLPTIASGALLIGRFGTGFASCLTLIVLYYFVCSYNGNTRTALLTVWVFAVSPWAIEQGRIFSPVQIFMPILLFLLWMAVRIHFKILLFFRHLSIAMAVGVFYWFLWDFQKDTGFSPSRDAARNLLEIFSPGMLFVSNTTFWWGGIKEFGMLFLSFSPFFFLGFLSMINSRQWLILSYIVIFGIVASFAPQFPEGRQFYLALPFLAYCVSYGMTLIPMRSFRVRGVLLCLFVLICIYEQQQFWHYYIVHYPMQIRGAMEKIIVPF